MGAKEDRERKARKKSKDIFRGDEDVAELADFGCLGDQRNSECPVKNVAKCGSDHRGDKDALFSRPNLP